MDQVNEIKTQISLNKQKKTRKWDYFFQIKGILTECFSESIISGMELEYTVTRKECRHILSYLEDLNLKKRWG
jgi:hypothetical protein